MASPRTTSGVRWRNWGRNQSVVPQAVARPITVDAVQEIVRDAAARGQRVKAVGAGHSFTDIAVAPGIQLQLDGLDGLLGVDRATGEATFAGGTRLFQIPALLAPHGLAMQNLGDIDRQSISGAISTGTHGSGTRFGGISTQVSAVLLVIGDGSLLRVSQQENPELLPAVALGLGALGIIVEVTLRCVPALVLRADERPEPLDELLESIVERAGLVDHLDAYWFPHTSAALVKTNTRLEPGAIPEPPSRLRSFVDDELLSNEVFRAVCALGTVAPGLIPGMNRLANAAVAQRTYSDWSHRVFVASRTVRFVEQEYAVPAESLPEVVRQIRAFIDRRDLRISFPVELRFTAADELMLSTASGRATGYVAVHRYYRDDHREYFAGVEDICRAVGGRPHWGKLHTQTAQSLRRLYPRFDEFTAARDRLDPSRTFANGYLDRVLGD
ncbi:D-arabinono-1,4-lactone oxidase [Naasia lichenicola]|uniref:FAD-binding protein n=1 Tax=Naasia lichenicola TaxID=2565933 RepID=A0A4S4FGE4_9MICO|nr:D-arabinono-1,4-lactone oxidase [Naasia lichenicola]THG28774.1 FAD-binding protein [Naasia lichenicola]